MRADGRFDGHIVQGHVDAVGAGPANFGALGDAAELAVDVPAALERYLVEKGSVAVDGISLTVAAARPASLHSGAHPVYTGTDEPPGRLGPGDPVNLEVDVIAKYVERLLGNGRADRGPKSHAGHAVQHDPRGHRRHPGGPDGRGRGRRGPRERGRPHHRGREGHPRRHQLHGPPRPRPHLPAHDRRAARRAPHPADGAGRAEQRQVRHRVLRAHRGQEGDDDRNLRGRPRAHRPRRHRSRDPAGTTSPAPDTCFRCGRCRAACSSARGRPRPPWTWPASPASIRRGSSARS